jgi:hypothetical protein
MSAAPILPIPVPLDPLTAALQLVNSILNLIAVVVESQPPDVRATLWRMHVEDLKEWRTFLKSLKLPEPPPPSGPREKRQPNGHPAKTRRMARRKS